jgi:hypothetical protein
MHDERAFLTQLEAEDVGSLEIRTRPPFKNGDFTVSHSVPLKTQALQDTGAPIVPVDRRPILIP